MKNKATAGNLQISHDQLKKLLLGDRISIRVENSRKVNFILELSLEQFESVEELTEFIRDIGMSQPPDIEFDEI